MTRSRVAQIFADSFSKYLAAGFQDALRNSCVAVGHTTFDEVGTEKHGNTLDGDVVLQSEGLVFQFAVVLLLVCDITSPCPCAMRVILAVWEVDCFPGESFFVY